MSAHRCGTVELVGRPNTGKSSLMNRLVETTLSSVSPKAQTTRHLIRGIVTRPDCQCIFVDSPGFIDKADNSLHRTLRRRSTEAMQDCDVVGFVVEAGRFGEADMKVLRQLPRDARVVAIVNKVDRMASHERLLPFLDELAKVRRFDEIVPVSAKTGRNVDRLLTVLCGLLPEGPAIYGPEDLTDRDERFFAAELLRGRLFVILGQELPYRCEAVVDSFKEEGGLRRIEATILVERDSQKGIVVGAGGATLKKIASGARRDMEKLFGGKVYLGVWVKVRKGWTDDERILRQLGHG
jgi:GTP-binding protein Era